MTDLRTRFESADELPAPDLWREIESRALAMSAAPAPGPAWLMIGLAALLMVGIGSAVLFGSGLVDLPVLPAPSPTESIGPSLDESPAQTETPTEPPGDGSTWIRTGDLHGGYSNEGSSLVLLEDGRALVTGSFDSSPQSATVTAELFDPAKMSWIETGDLTGRRLWHTSTVLADGRVLVAGGSDPRPIGRVPSDRVCHGGSVRPAHRDVDGHGPDVEASSRAQRNPSS